MFRDTCDVYIRNVGRGTKKATIAACEEIMADSLVQVPKDTRTLESSAFYIVARRTDTSAKTWAYEALVGYGGKGDPINPKTGLSASNYMVTVHENLQYFHKVGKAKFLEDPVRTYAMSRFPKTVIKHLRESLAESSK